MSVSKKRLFIAITLLYLFFACTDRQNPSEPEIDGPKTGTEIRGPISGILEKKNSPFYVKQNIYVDSLNSLKIEAGVELNFDDSTKFDIFGTIISVGDTSNFITYTSQSDSWFGINLENSNNVNRFEFCIINNVQVLDYHISEFGALALYRSRAVISNCVFSNNFAMNGGGISIISSDAEIKNNLFIKNHAVTLGGAIISVESTSRIYNNTIFRNSTTNYGGGLVLVDPVFDDVQNNIFCLINFKRVFNNFFNIFL